MSFYLTSFSDRETSNRYFGTFKYLILLKFCIWFRHGDNGMWSGKFLSIFKMVASTRKITWKAAGRYFGNIMHMFSYDGNAKEYSQSGWKVTDYLFLNNPFNTGNIKKGLESRMQEGKCVSSKLNTVNATTRRVTFFLPTLSIWESNKSLLRVERKLLWRLKSKK